MRAPRAAIVVAPALVLLLQAAGVAAVGTEITYGPWPAASTSSV